MPSSLLIRNAKVLTPNLGLKPVKRSILVKDGKISKILSPSEPVEEEKVESLDADGLFALPGFIDAHTHLGIMPLELGSSDYAVEKSDPITPHFSVLDSLDPFDEGFKEAIKAGVTTVAISLGSYMSFGKIVEAITIIPGQVSILKTNLRTLNEFFGVKFAIGEHPKRFLESLKLTPTTRMGMLAAIRANLSKAREYSNNKMKGKNETLTDLKMEALSKLIEGNVYALVHAHLARDMLSIVRIFDDFGVRKVIFVHGTEAYEISEFLKERRIPVIFGPIVFSKRGTELRNLSSKTPALLYKKGVDFCLTTDHPTIPISYLPLLSAVAVSEGLPYEKALSAITIDAARILGISDRVGSIEVGKDADIVLIEGDPLDVDSKVAYTIIDGEIVYKR